MQIESDFEKKFPIKNNSLSIIKNPKFLPNAKLPINEWVIFDQVSLFNILQKNVDFNHSISISKEDIIF